MSAQVLSLATEDQVDRAWEAYASLARQLSSDPTLLADRSFNEEMSRRHERWRKLFMMQEASQ